MPREQLQRFFLKGTGAHAGKVRVRPELAAMVKFSPAQPAEPGWSVDGALRRDLLPQRDDLFRQADAGRRSCSASRRCMKPDALLFAGHSENFSFVDETLRPRGQTVYGLA